MKPHLDQDWRSCLLTQASQKDLPPSLDQRGGGGGGSLTAIRKNTMQLREKPLE